MVPDRRKAGLKTAWVVGLVAALLVSVEAVAQPSSELFWSNPVDSTAIWTASRARISPHLVPQASITGHYALKPVSLWDKAGDKILVSPLKHQVKFDLGLGIGLFDYVELGLVLPVVAYQSSESNDYSEMYNVRTDLNIFGISDVRFHLKGRFFRYSGFGMGAQARVLLPTQSQPYQAEDRLRVDLGLTFDYELDWTYPMVFALNLGWVIRPNVVEPYYQVNDQLTMAFGAEFTAIPDLLNVIANVYGRFEVLASSENTAKSATIEGMAGVRAFIGKTGLSTSFGLGTGFIKGYGGSNFRLLFQLAFSPRLDSEVGYTLEEKATWPIDKDGNPVHPVACVNSPETCDLEANRDRDGDGIPDLIDQCPDEPEDRDGFEDEDGCPDPDNDQDGIMDFEDACPNEPGIPELKGCPFLDSDGDGIADSEDLCPNDPEDFDGYEDQDGCPDYDNDGDGFPDSEDLCPNVPGTKQGCPDEGSVVRLSGHRIEILEKIYFMTAKAIIQKKSYHVLDEVAVFMKSHPEIKLVRVEGHADDRGSTKTNLPLSQDRANAVKEYLIRAGVDATRLSARGYGNSHPIVFNKSNKARATNRRVEFHIIEREKK